MIEVQSSKAFLSARAMVYQNPKFLHRLLRKLTSLTINYLNAQIRAGVGALNYLLQIAVEVIREKEERRIPLIFFTKNGRKWLEKIVTSGGWGCDAIGLDN